jgi:ribonuclease VapC
MRKYLLDASALLAVLTDEPGAEKVRQFLAHHPCSISVVNLAEVAGKLCQLGMPFPLARDACSSFSLKVIAATPEHCWAAAQMAVSGRHLGLSLGDRFCLGTALAEESIAVTADRNWNKIEGGPRLELIR